MTSRLRRAWVRALLRLCPARVRLEDGDEIVGVFEHTLARAAQHRPPWLRPWIWTLATVDLLRFAWTTHRDTGTLGSYDIHLSFRERIAHMVRTMLQDLRFGARLLVKDRSFALTAILTLAVCIGANTAIFSVVRSVVLKPLPVPQSERLVSLHNSYPNAGSDHSSSGVPDYFDRKTQMTVFEDVAVYRRSGTTFGSAEGAERLTSVLATPSLFTILRVPPIKGRLFTEAEGEVGHEHETILSFGMWQRHFAGDPNVVGRSVRLGGEVYQIVGVMPASFTFVWNDVDLWTPAAFTPEDKSDEKRHSNNWEMVGRLKPGATVAQAQQELDAINARNDQRFPELHQVLKDAGFHSVAIGLQDELTSQIRPVLYLLWGGVLFVLLIGCVNIANLVVVRSSGRVRELATRHALGAGRGRLVRQALTETMLLAVIGGAAGIALGSWLLRALTSFGLDQLPRGYEIRLDVVSVAAIAALTVVVGGAIGLLPMLRLARLDVNAALRDDGRGSTGSRRSTTVRRTLAVAQLAIATILLAGAGLMFASFRAALGLDPGFRSDHVLTAALSMPSVTYPKSDDRVAFTDRLVASIERLPGVEAAGTVTVLPFSGNESDSVILAEGYAMKPGESLISPTQSIVSEDYFKALRIPLVRGRSFTASDTMPAQHVVIVDERLARKFWPDTDPIGRRMYLPESAKNLFKKPPDSDMLTVVGVVKEVQLTDPAAAKSVGAYYFPYRQQPSAATSLVVRTTGDPAAMTAEVRRQAQAIDLQLPIFDVRTLDDRLSAGFLGTRVPMLIATAFAAVALLLAAIGIYGVLAYGVSQRRREIGIRMALGSSAQRIFQLVIGDGLRIVIVGLVLGLAGALFVGRAMESRLFHVSSTDPLVLSVVVAILAIVALAATLVPARRAAKVNPIQALSEN